MRTVVYRAWQHAKVQSRAEVYQWKQNQNTDFEGMPNLQRNMINVLTAASTLVDGRRLSQGDADILVDLQHPKHDSVYECVHPLLDRDIQSDFEVLRHYQLPVIAHVALLKKMPNWMGCPGGKDHLGLYALCSHNPDGKWDWYEIGGRYNGRIRGVQTPRRYQHASDIGANTLVAAECLRSPDLSKRLPHAVLTPHSEWIERSSINSTMSGWYVREQPMRQWQQRVRRILRTFSDHRVACVDTHS